MVSHGWGICSDVEPITELEKVLYAIDELTGLVATTALIRPSKSILDVKPKSVKKKWKDKRFAAGVDRSIIEKGAGMLGVEISDLIRDTLAGMQEVAEEIGLKGTPRNGCEKTMNLAQFPRRRYTQGQTPIEKLPRFSKAVGGPDIYMKRDDLLGLTGGGNKTRKLEFLVADALETGRRHPHHQRGRPIQSLPLDPFGGGQGRDEMSAGLERVMSRQLRPESRGEHFPVPSPGCRKN